MKRESRGLPAVDPCSAAGTPVDPTTTAAAAIDPGTATTTTIDESCIFDRRALSGSGERPSIQLSMIPRRTFPDDFYLPVTKPRRDNIQTLQSGITVASP